MPAERYFYPHPLHQDQEITIIDQEYHHLVNVMRTRVGETLEIINGKGVLAFGALLQIEKKRAILQIQQLQFHPKPLPSLILAQAIPRMNRLEFILEKGTELGLSEIWLFPSTHSEKSEFSKNQMVRLETILATALKQCGRLYLPELKIFSSIKNLPVSDLLKFFGDTSLEALTFKLKLDVPNIKKGALFSVGPESGFTDQEHHELKNQGFEGVKLHPNILRTDTAAIAAITLLSHYIF